MPDRIETTTSQVDGSNVFRVDRGKNLRELTLDKMRSAIFDGHLQPGARLIERPLCEQLGVSRSIVREVLRHLETECLVETRLGRGPVVATLTPRQAAEIYGIRALLEGEAAYLCATLASEEEISGFSSLNDRIQEAFGAGDLHAVMLRTSAFYEAIFKCSGMHIAWEVFQSLNARINRLRFITISTPGRMSDAAAEMEGILQALRRRDPDAARLASQDHMRRVAAIASTKLMEAEQEAVRTNSLKIHQGKR